MRRIYGACAAALALTAPPALAGNNGLPAGWSAPSQPEHGALVFDDEFDGCTGLWRPGAGWVIGRHAVMHAGERMAWAGDPSAYTCSGGVLTLATRPSLVVPGVMTEADVETAATFGPDFYAEVRFQGQQIAGQHSGVWLLGVEAGQGHPELDIVEQYGPDDQYDHAASHLWPGPSAQTAHVYASALIPRPEGKAVGWHTYGLQATPTAFTVWRDGAPVQTIPRQPRQRTPMYLLVSLFGNDAPAPAAVKVDYVRVYAAP